jgi:hypothetical protein
VELPAGTYQVTETPAPPCLIDSEAFDNEGNLVVEAGQSVEVRVYNCELPDVAASPEPEDGTEPGSGVGVTVLKFQCPGAQVNAADCLPATEPATVTFTPAAGGEPTTLTTDGTGAATADLPPGVYRVTEIPVTACLVDSDALDPEGNLVVEADPVELRVYNCGGS